MEDKLYKEIEAYLGGDMSKEEMSTFEGRIQENKDLKNEVALYRTLNLHLGNKTQLEDPVSNTFTKKLAAYIESDEAKALKNKLKEENL